MGLNYLFVGSSIGYYFPTNNFLQGNIKPFSKFHSSGAVKQKSSNVVLPKKAIAPLQQT
jgi:hypothetical protein